METIYETYIRQICSNCKNKENCKEKLQRKRDNTMKCEIYERINYDNCMKRKCKKCKFYDECFKDKK